MTNRWSRVGARNLALAAATLAVSGCASIDHEQVRLCRSALPALEPAGRIILVSEQADPRAAHGIEIAYRVDSGRRLREGLLRCGFGGGRLHPERLDLLAVEVGGQRLGEARLLFLKRFWLGDPSAIREGMQRIDNPPAATLLATRISPGLSYFVQQVVNAVPIGAIYALFALAYAFLYGLIRRINLAFGEIAIYGGLVLINVVTLVATLSAGISPIVAVALAFVACAVAAGAAGLAGAVVGRLVFRPLANAGPRAFLIATIGLAIALGEGLRLVSGSRERWLQPYMNQPLLLVDADLPVTVTVIKLVEIGAAVSALAALALVMSRSRFGVHWRAVADDPGMARMLGVDTMRIAMVTFAISAALAGLAGALTSLHYGHASFSAGLMIGLKALFAALLGGIGSLPGAALGGLAIGLGETLWSAYMPLAYRDVAILAALVLVLVLRPQGLFGTSENIAPARSGQL